MIRIVATQPYSDQKPGTSGLRKKVKVFQQPNYVENYLQAIFNSLEGFSGQTLVIGGDGRFYNREAIQKAIRLALANGFGRIVVGRGGLLSTPAVSALIRSLHTFGGIILSASHNPGGPDGDFGIKYNIGNGGPAPEKITDAIYAQTKTINSYKTLNAPDVDLDALGVTALGGGTVEIVDPVTNYAALMRTLFNFDAIRALFASGFRMRFDAMHAITGPYAHAILEGELGAAAGTVVNGTPLTDFGGHHPDPDLTYAKDLYDLLMSKQAPDSRRLRWRRRPQPDHRPRPVRHPLRFARHARRQRPASRRATPRGSRDRALDADQRRRRPRRRQARRSRLRNPDRLEILRQPARRRTGDDLRRGERRHRLRPCAREGRVWAVLLWLNILARRRISVAELARQHWASYGRNYYTRHDFEEVDLAAANGLIDALRAQFANLPGKRFGTLLRSRRPTISNITIRSTAPTPRVRACG